MIFDMCAKITFRTLIPPHSRRNHRLRTVTDRTMNTNTGASTNNTANARETPNAAVSGGTSRATAVDIAFDARRAQNAASYHENRGEICVFKATPIVFMYCFHLLSLRSFVCSARSEGYYLRWSSIHDSGGLYLPPVYERAVPSFHCV